MESENIKKGILRKAVKHKRKIIITLAIIVAVVVVVWFVIPHIYNLIHPKSTVTVTTLEKAIDISNLYTCETTYNGVVEVKNKKSDNTEYYVAYEAVVKSGVDSDKVVVDENEIDGRRTIVVNLPDKTVDSVNVDYGSMEFIYMDQNKNEQGLSKEAYQYCKEDAKANARENQALHKFARKNAERYIKALTKSLIENCNEDIAVVVR